MLRGRGYRLPPPHTQHVCTLAPGPFSPLSSPLSLPSTPSFLPFPAHRHVSGPLKTFQDFSYSLDLPWPHSYREESNRTGVG